MTAAGEAADADSHAGAAAPASDEAPPRGWYTVIILGVVSMLSFVDRGVMALFVQPIKRDFNLSDTEMSLLLGLAFTLPYVLVGFPMSRFIDRGNRRNLIAGCLGLWSAATATCGIAQNYWTLFAARFVTGGAESVNTSGSLSMIADSVPRHRLPRAYAIQAAGVSGGAALSLLIGGVLFGLLVHVEPFHVPLIGIIHNWQLVFMIVGIPGLTVAAIMLFTVPEPQRKGGSRPGGYPLREVFGHIWGSRKFHVPLLLGMLVNAMLLFGFAAWMPAFYERTYGWGPEIAGPLMGVVSLFATLAGLIVGARLAEVLAERRDDANLRVLFLGHLIALPMLIAAPLMPNPWLALGLNAAAVAFGVLGNPGFSAAIQITAPNEMRAQVAVMYAAGITAIGGTLGPTLIGVLTDFVASSESDLRYVLVAVKAVLGPIAVFLIWKSLSAYGKIYRQRIEESAI